VTPVTDGGGPDEVAAGAVFEAYRAGRLPLDERGVGFLVGRALGARGPVAFDVGAEGRLSAAFEPTADVLVDGDDPEAAVVVGAGEDGLASRDALYDALGRALVLRQAPATESAAALARVSVAGPVRAEDDGGEDEVDARAEWTESLVAAARAAGVGLLHVDRRGVETLVAPATTPSYSPDLAEAVLSGVREVYAGTAAEPGEGLARRAADVAAAHPDAVE
jgi:hypothetical protein